MSINTRQQSLALLPSISAWVKAAKLAIPAYGCATVVMSAAVWQFLLIGGIAGLAGAGLEGFGFCLMLSAVALSMSIIWFLLWTGIYGLVLKLLWSKPPKWLALPDAITLAQRDFPILTLSTLPIAILFLLRIALNVSLRQSLQSPPSFSLSYDAFFLKFFWLWLMSASALYHRWPEQVAKCHSRNRLEKQSR